MSPEGGHYDTQQDQDNEAPIYPSPRVMTAVIARPFLLFAIHQATDNSILLISVASLSSAREEFIRYDTGHFCNASSSADFKYSAPASPLSHGLNCSWVS